MKRFFSVLKTVFLSLGVIVGAGFISGKEPVSYFGETNNLFDCLLFGVLFFLSLSVCFLGEEKNDFPICGLLADFIVCASMLSALDSLSVFFGVNCAVPLFSLSVLVISPIVANGGLKRLERFNVFIMLLPIIVLSLIFFGESGKTEPVFALSFENLGVLPLTFCNLYLALPVLKKSVDGKTKKFKLTVAAAVGLSLSVILFAVMSLCAKQGASSFDLPLLAFVDKNRVLSVAVLLTATTLSSVLSLYYPLRECAVAIGGGIGIPLLTLSLFAFSRLGVSDIVGYCYPLIGVFGFFKTLKCFAKTIKKSRYKKFSKENNNKKTNKKGETVCQERKEKTKWLNSPKNNTINT